MNTVSVTVGSAAPDIPLGRRGENEATVVIFDVSSLAENYGDGTAVLLAKRAGDSTAYPVTVVQEGNTVTWTVTSADTAYRGLGKCELYWYVGDLLAKTVVYATVVGRDIGETTEDPPDAYETWVASLSELGAETLANAAAAAAAQGAAEAAQEAAETAQTSAETAQGAAETAQAAAESAQSEAEDSATLAESWAVGGTGTRTGEDADNAKYYSELAAQAADEAGYVAFEIDGSGHLIFTKTTTTDLSFTLSGGHLILEVA